MRTRAVVVGSGAGGSVAAMVLAESGYDVVVLEKGPNYVDGLGTGALTTRLGADELAGPIRRLEYPDDLGEPRLFDFRGESSVPIQGEINALPSVVGGGTIHWDAKTPRYWDIDFQKHTALGPIAGADVVDWPFEYLDLANTYDEVERMLGVQGDVAAMPAHPTMEHSPRSGPFVMRPGRPQRSSVVLAKGAREIGCAPFPMPMAINSEWYGGRPACVDCGFCDGYGCPIFARGGALTPLDAAVNAGAEVRSECFAVRLVYDGRSARAVEYVDSAGDKRTETADVVILAGSAIETCRLALLSELPDRSARIGTGLMFHACSVAYGVFPDLAFIEEGRGHTHAIDEFADPDYQSARDAAKASGLSYIRGGIVELGFRPFGLVEEAHLYRRLLERISPDHPFGALFKELMRARTLGRRTLGVMMHAEDLSQVQNRVSIDAHRRDWRGVPIPRIEYRPHVHERVAQSAYLPLMRKVLECAGASITTAMPEMRTATNTLGGRVPTDFHTLGGMRMGNSEATSVTDPWGRLWGTDNVFVVDGSLFPTSGAHNPTLTIMAVALRCMKHLAPSWRFKGERSSLQVPVVPGAS